MVVTWQFGQVSVIRQVRRLRLRSGDHMLMTDELSVYFDNPPTDALGNEHVEGQLRCGRKNVTLHFKERDRTFRKSEPISVEIGYDEIDFVKYEPGGWFKPKLLKIRISTPEKFTDFPGAEVGQVTLYVEKQSRKAASSLENFVDYRQSEAALAKRDGELNEMRDGLDSAI